MNKLFFFVNIIELKIFLKLISNEKFIKTAINQFLRVYTRSVSTSNVLKFQQTKKLLDDAKKQEQQQADTKQSNKDANTSSDGDGDKFKNIFSGRIKIGGSGSKSSDGSGSSR